MECLLTVRCQFYIPLNFCAIYFESIQTFRDHLLSKDTYLSDKSKSKGKVVPLQPWTGPEGSRKLRFSDFVTTAQDGGRLSALHTSHLYPPGNIPGTHFCWRLSQPQHYSAAGRIMSMKNSSDTIRNWICDLLACSTGPQPTVHCVPSKCCQYITLLMSVGGTQNIWLSQKTVSVYRVI